ncbi:hypothetical protein ABZ714_03120 [Streptomyces sp. NPDC006798]|uniref:RICIN domain-containing protein n=1 Tax=Streptomyces sp. NPDC006798 TaxID=3155462 RepID=UPI0033DBA03E
MGNQREMSPREARDAADFAALLRGLKEQSGLTYRGLEEAAARRGEVLPRSTCAAVLNGRGLPRAELLTVFVRVCGEGDRVGEWLAARSRLAGQRAGRAARGQDGTGPGAGGGPRTAVAGPGPLRDSGGPPGGGESRGGGPPGPSRRRISVLAGLPAAALLAGLSVWLVGASERPRPPSDDGPVSAVAAPPDGYVRLRPLSAPELCLTDGRVADRRHTPLVAVQRPCDEVAPQSTTLESTGKDSYRVLWHHPDYGTGCLKALADGVGKGLLEPWDDCARASRFHIEPSGPPGDSGFVLRVPGRGCAGIRDGSGDEGTEAVMSRCTGSDGQVFVIERV